MSNARPRPVVGQTLYALNVGNNAKHQEQRLTPVEVVSVGRKYFKAIPEAYRKSPHMAIEYHIDDWRQRTDYTAGYRLLASEQDWTDEKEAHALEHDLWELFRGSGARRCSLESLRIAHRVLIAPPSANGK